MKPISKIFSVYLLVILLILLANTSFGQITVKHFNAGWNDANKVEFVDDLSDCKIKHVDIAQDAKLQEKHEIVIVPTIVIFSDGEEVKRWQADITFSMKATREEIQEFIDELIMSDF